MNGLINHGEVFDPNDHEFRQFYLLKFRNSYMQTLRPLSEVDAGTMDWHISDLIWAADSFADIFGKAQLRDVLRHLLRRDDYFLS